MGSADPKEKEISRFFKRIRQNLDALVVEPDPHISKSTIDFSNCTDITDQLYGNISKEEFKSILDAYDKQKDSKDFDKAIECDTVQGKSYAKLLLSKKGFFHPQSTAFLIDDLKIKDVSRNTFLGGHSTYDVTVDEALNGIIKTQLKLNIDKLVTEAHEFLDNNRTNDAKELVETLKGLNQDDASIDLLRGRYNLAKSHWEESVRLYRRAIEKGVFITRRDTAGFSEALYQLGERNYFKQDYKAALDLFQESLHYDPDHAGSQLHRGLCLTKLAKQNSFSQKGPAYRG